jgi:hypothetical protein
MKKNNEKGRRARESIVKLSFAEGPEMLKHTLPESPTDGRI